MVCIGVKGGRVHSAQVLSTKGYTHPVGVLSEGRGGRRLQVRGGEGYPDWLIVPSPTWTGQILVGGYPDKKDGKMKHQRLSVFANIGFLFVIVSAIHNPEANNATKVASINSFILF